MPFEWADGQTGVHLQDGPWLKASQLVSKLVGSRRRAGRGPFKPAPDHNMRIFSAQRQCGSSMLGSLNFAGVSKMCKLGSFYSASCRLDSAHPCWGSSPGTVEDVHAIWSRRWGWGRSSVFDVDQFSGNHLPRVSSTSNAKLALARAFFFCLRPRRTCRLRRGSRQFTPTHAHTHTHYPVPPIRLTTPVGN